MRQATEEGFMLDVLANFTSYRNAFTLAYQTCTTVVAKAATMSSTPM